MLTRQLLTNTVLRIFRKAKRNIRIRDLFSLNKWHYWLAKARQELDRSRIELFGGYDGKIYRQLTLDQAHYHFNTLRADWHDIIRGAVHSFEYRPRFSIIMPVYNTEVKWLRQAIDSIIHQIYPFWELCVADDASTNPDTLELLKGYEEDNRINVIHRKKNGNISKASNNAAEMASGDYLVFMDHDDLIAPNALFDIAEILQTNRDAEVIYSDENKVSESGQFYDTHFKPDWSPTLLLGYNYINHLVCMSKPLFESVNGFREGYDGAQDYDLLLRTCFNCHKILHIPKVLYHWRAISGSTARRASDKPQLTTSAYQALKDHIKHANLNCHVYAPSWALAHRLPVYQLDGPDEGHSIDIIIPTRNQGQLLLQCIKSIIQKTTYNNYHILVIDNESDDPETLAIFSRLKQQGIRIETIPNDENGFSYAGICNKAVDYCRADYLLFLNDDTKVVHKKWLSRMMAYLSLPGVGIAGACLLYPDKSVQHAGVTLHMNNGIAPAHAFKGASQQDLTYFFMGKTARECSAVTGACLLTSKKLFQAINGFDEDHYRVSLNDIDYCLRSKIDGQKGTVYVPGATLIHHESRSRQREDDPLELVHFNQSYKHLPDPYYNPNLSKIKPFDVSPTPNQMSYVGYLGRPLKVLMFSHNLNLEGASSVAVNLAVELSAFNTIETKLVSFMDGPLKQKLTESQVPVSICKLSGTDNVLQGWANQEGFETDIKTLEAMLAVEKPDVIIANVLNNFFVVNAALQNNIPAILIIHESYTKKQLLEILPPFAVTDFEAAMRHANRVLFVSKQTQSMYERYNQLHNFMAIRNALKYDYPEKSLSDHEKLVLRDKLGLPENKKLILNVGTICERKDQATLVRAAAILSQKREDFVCVLVGARSMIFIRTE